MKRALAWTIMGAAMLVALVAILPILPVLIPALLIFGAIFWAMITILDA